MPMWSRPSLSGGVLLRNLDGVGRVAFTPRSTHPGERQKSRFSSPGSRLCFRLCTDFLTRCPLFGDLFVSWPALGFYTGAMLGAHDGYIGSIPSCHRVRTIWVSVDYAEERESL